MMGRVTNYSKEYLLFKSMVYVEEYGMKSITARELAEFCGCSTYPIYTHFKSISGLKEKILEEITVYFENYLAECSSDDVLRIVYLLKDFFSIHESIREIIAKSDLDMDSLFKRPFFSYVKGHTKIKEEKSLELVWLNALGSLRSDDSSQDFLEMMNAVGDKNEVTDEYLENILKEQSP
ncbi:TetR/AcrR family transcriptional regulator [Enterococcus faecium]|uniref:TetR/AcrR family transcriptional regulator n=1 Tax=Enterococcus faecium TaxID=1352 RepID=UPI00326607F0